MDKVKGCCGGGSPKLIFACSGAADVGEVADRAARRLSAEGAGRMYCSVGIGGRIPAIMANTAAASAVLAIDGCPVECVRHSLEEAGFNNFEHLRLADLGMVKGATPPDAETVEKVVAEAASLLSRGHTRISRVLVATDLSEESNAIVNCVSGMTGIGVRQCTLLHCVNAGEAAVAAMSDDGGADTRSKLDAQKAILESGGMAVQTKTIQCAAETAINQLAEESHQSIIVLGTRGHTIWHDIFLRGVTSETVHRSTMPILLVPLADNGAFCCGDGANCACNIGSHVMFATDFSTSAATAFKHLNGLAASGGCGEFTLCHVQDQAHICPSLDGRLEEFNQIDGRRLESAKEELIAAGAAKVNIQIAFGDPTREIMRIAADSHATMLVIGTKGRSLMSELVFGGVAQHLIRHPPIPMLLVPDVQSCLR